MYSLKNRERRKNNLTQLFLPEVIRMLFDGKLRFYFMTSVHISEKLYNVSIKKK